jgi:hypothetical protein
VELEPILSEEALDEVEEKVAESAVEQWSATVASDDPVALSVTSAMPVEPRVAVQHASPSRTTGNDMAAQPIHVSKSPFDSKDLDQCFVNACEEYHDGDFPLAFRSSFEPSLTQTVAERTRRRRGDARYLDRLLWGQIV